MNQIYTGVVEDVLDPLKLGRVRVRVFGLHSDDRSLIPTTSLPWASVATPANSASMSGIGITPTGLLPGSWVVLFFSDPDNQYPVVFASLPGIPADTVNQTVAYEETSLTQPEEAAAVPKQNPDNPVTKGEVDKAVDIQLTGLRRATDFSSVSDDCINLIKGEETFQARAYKDFDGKYLIGYGAQKIDGKFVVEGQVITEAQAAAALKQYVNEISLPEVKKAVKVLITQSMLDALVDLNYNMGGPTFRKTSILSDLNAEKYLQAASNFSQYTADATGVTRGGLIRRRKAEAALFLKDGVPTQSGELEKQEKTNDAVNYENGKIVSINTNKVLASRGFTDPSGIYPLYRNEPDTNRLARHENIDKTIVYRKEASRETGVPIAISGKTWNQSPIPYNAVYPHNSVYGTKSGHIMEFDDTPNSRRIHLYHAAGTFTEIDDNGTQVNRIVGDGYEIIDRNGYVYVKGTNHVTVDGSKSLRVGGTMSIEVMGDTTINARGNATLNVSGNLSTAVSGNYKIKVGGSFAVDATMIYQNSGNASSVASAPSKGVSEEKTFSQLSVITRNDEQSMQYETLDDGNPEAYNADRLKNGSLTKEELSAKPKEEKTEAVSENSVKAISSDCGEIHQMSEFPPSLALSNRFTVGDLNKNGARKIINQKGLSTQDIACNLKMLCLNVLDTVKEMYPNMIITSGFRRPGDVANSATNSQHYLGEAADIQLPGFSKAQYLEAAKAIQQAVPYDQLILEYAGTSTVWIHLSYKKSGNRKQVFTMHNHSKISDYGQLKLIA